MESSKKKDLLYYAKSLNEDFKFQSIASSMVENGIELKDIMLELKGQHERSYSNEIKKIELYPYNKDKLKLELRINGFYDLMPQTFFHDFKKYGSNNVKRMTKETAELKKEEDDYRNLFFPFEYFLKKELIKLELKEREIHKEINNSLIKKLFKLSNDKIADIPEVMLDTFYSLLQYTKIIQKNFNFIKDAFEICLKEKVNLKISKTKLNKSINESLLSHAILGIDSICGNSFISNIEKININIGPIKNWSSSEDFIKLKRFVNILIEYFIPYHYNIEIDYTFDRLPLELMESRDDNPYMLGYNISI